MKLFLVGILFLLAAGYVGGQSDLLDQETKNRADAQAQLDYEQELLKQLPELRKQQRINQERARVEVGTFTDATGLATLRRLPARGLSLTCEEDAKVTIGDTEPGLPVFKVRLSGPSARVIAWLEAVERSPRPMWLTLVDLKSPAPGQLAGTLKVMAVPAP